jgi:hypothetical protein
MIGWKRSYLRAKDNIVTFGNTRVGRSCIVISIGVGIGAIILDGLAIRGCGASTSRIVGASATIFVGIILGASALAARKIAIFGDLHVVRATGKRGAGRRAACALAINGSDGNR